MQYLCLVRIDDDLMNRLTPEEDRQQQRQSLAYDEELKRRGKLIAASPVMGADSATVVRTRNGTVSMTDGPYVETKEHLGGFLLIDARDLNEALDIIAKEPVARFGSIEVRPTWSLDP